MLQRQVKQIHDRHTQLVLVSVRQVVITENGLFHGREDSHKDRREVLHQRILVQLHLPRREGKAQPMHQFHCTASQGRISHVTVRRHHNAEGGEYSIWVKVREETRWNPVAFSLRRSVPVQIEQLDDVLEHRARKSIPHRSRLRRRQRRLASSGSVQKEMEGQINEVTEALEEGTLSQYRLRQQEFSPCSFRNRRVLLVERRRTPLERVERLLGHRQ
mmetsp:Transcript_26750/g.70264  ORF Transcript_26750/g.70264 Transcript_26750/m.70264 type:complete len:217 (+) Transcript_26750:1287-1937(+)